METTIDAGGRIVVPKRYRDLLGLAPGQRVEIELDGAALRVAPVVEPSALHEVDGVLVAGEPGVVAPQLGADEERALLEALRERRR